MKKRKLKIDWTCRDGVNHEHRWNWSAGLCVFWHCYRNRLKDRFGHALCNLVGHPVTSRTDLHYGFWCYRCSKGVYARWYLLPWYALKVAIREPFAKCPDCGKRFFQHDPNVEHMPF